MPVKLICPTRSAYTYPLLIKNLLLAPLSNAADQEISYQGKIRYSYRQFNERLCRLANGLTALHVEAGQTVAVMDWDSHRYLECFFAIPMMGAVLQTVNVRLSAEQILYTLNHAKADVVLVNREFLPLLAAVHQRLETVRTLILIDDEGTPIEAPFAFAAEYEEMLSKAVPDFNFPDFDENAQATTFYTTGTTGLPKGVQFSHRQLVLHTLGLSAHVGTIYATGRLHKDDVYMPLTPMFHVHAWGFPYVATMLGLRQVYPGRYVPANLLQLIQSEKVSYSHCVPSILQMLLNHPGSENFTLANWKVVIGGSAMSEALALAAVQRGIDPIVGYGMSETCPVVSYASLSRQEMQAPLVEQIRLRCKTGFALPLVDVRVVTPTMQPIPRDGQSTGEVVLRAPWLTQAYVNAPQASEELWNGGYLHTQDIGHMNAQGQLKVTDRIKDVIKTAGEWISSLHVEDILAQHEAVQESAVIGIPDEKWGERPLALVVLKANFIGKVSEREMRNFTANLVEKTGISRHSVLLQVRFVPNLIKTSVGKLNKREMRAFYSGSPS